MSNLHYLEEWFLTLLAVLNPTSSISAFIELFAVAKTKCAMFSLNSKYIYIYNSVLLHKLAKAEHDDINYTSGMSQNRPTSEIDSPNPWGLIKPRFRPTYLEQGKRGILLSVQNYVQWKIVLVIVVGISCLRRF